MLRAIVCAVAVLSSAPALADDHDGKFELGGRVFLRDSAVKVSDSAADWQSELDIASARLAGNYEIGHLLKTQVEVELADGELELKDAYIQYRPIRVLRIQVGRFKRPISPLSMEGAYGLPLVERGVLNDKLSAGTVDVPFPLGGRTEGAMVQVRPKLPLNPRATIGLFNSRLADSNLAGVDLVDVGINRFQDVFGRVSVEVVHDLRVGATVAAYQRLRNLDGDVNHAGLVGLDVTLDHDLGRLWLEGFYGRTPYVDPVEGRVRGAMWAGRLVAAPRIDELVDLPVERLEPFLSVAVLEPSTTLSQSRALQVGGGVSVSIIDQLKAQIEYVYLDTQVQFPIASLHRIFFQVASKF